MKQTFGILFVVTLVMLLTLACNCPKEVTVTVKTKDGESCLVEQKCKMVFTAVEKDDNEYGKVYYRCLVTEGFYNNSGVEDKVLVNVKSNDCERLNP